MRITSWRELIIEEMSKHGDSLLEFESSTFSDDGMDIEFDGGYGGVCGEPFTLWTKRRVYFPVKYDGAEWAGSASRNPDGEPTEHLGGGG